jgi:hypothetical protein
VVSRMLRAMAKLGLVEKDLYVPVAPTGLTSPVYVTEEGYAKLQALAQEMLETGAIELAVQSVVCEDWTSKESQERDPAVLTAGLRRVRKSFGDHGELDWDKWISNESEPTWEVLAWVDPKELARRRERYRQRRRERRKLEKAVNREWARHAPLLHEWYRRADN